MTRLFAVGVLVLACGLGGCASTYRPHLASTTPHLDAETRRDLRTVEIGRTYRIRFPGLVDNEVTARLECVTRYRTDYSIQEYDTGRYWRYMTISEEFEGADPYTTILEVPITVLIRALHGNSPKTYWDERIVGSERIVERSEESTGLHYAEGERLIFEGVGERTTGSDGTATVPVSARLLKRGMTVEHPRSGAKYEIRLIRKSGLSKNTKDLLHTGNTAYTILDIFRLVILRILGRITPISFVVCVAVDVAMGVVIDYGIEEMTLKCHDCGKKWKIETIQTPSLNVKCPNPECGASARLRIQP